MNECCIKGSYLSDPGGSKHSSSDSHGSYSTVMIHCYHGCSKMFHASIPSIPLPLHSTASLNNPYIWICAALFQLTCTAQPSRSKLWRCDLCICKWYSDPGDAVAPSGASSWSQRRTLGHFTCWYLHELCHWVILCLLLLVTALESIFGPFSHGEWEEFILNMWQPSPFK